MDHSNLPNSYNNTTQEGYHATDPRVSATHNRYEHESLRGDIHSQLLALNPYPNTNSNPYMNHQTEESMTAGYRHWNYHDDNVSYAAFTYCEQGEGQITEYQYQSVFVQVESGQQSEWTHESYIFDY